MGTLIEIVRGDQNFILSFYIKDADGNPLSLAAVSSIVLKFKDYSDGSLRTISGTVSDADQGLAKFNVGTTFVGLEGEYKGEIEITYTDGTVLTAPNITIKVIPDLV